MSVCQQRDITPFILYPWLGPNTELQDTSGQSCHLHGYVFNIANTNVYLDVKFRRVLHLKCHSLIHANNTFDQLDELSVSLKSKRLVDFNDRDAKAQRMVETV
ncbi:hypothetical protein ATANTOWER_008273 [Ataeniobius toweri]|uniref:Uncharacterized protein n=1 Tax=Ataeniobius toweri TaxID=208326 RepID=A0ABU7AJP5_9TELE|nr:hypothetical protein [Ataeniobius toweri]